MENTPASASSYLLSMGLPGIVILGLAAAVWVLYRQLIATHTAFATELKEKDKELKTIHGRSVEAVERSTAALDKHSEVVSKMEATVRRRKGEAQ